MRLDLEQLPDYLFVTVIDLWTLVIAEFRKIIGEKESFPGNFLTDKFCDIPESIRYCICKNNHSLKLMLTCCIFLSTTG